MWYLLYTMTVVAHFADLGMMATGPFQTVIECESYAEQTWQKEDGWSESEAQPSNRYNWFNSNYRIHYRENPKAAMGLYYSCIEMREPK